MQACQAKHLNPCNIGYLYDIQQSTLDVALHAAFTNALKKDPNAKIVDTGQDFFTPTTGESAVQTMMSAHPEINLIAASDQGIEGAADASSAAKAVLVGFGASQAGIAGVKSGRWFGTVAQDPATEGKDGVLTLVNAIRNNKNYPGQNPLNSLPDKGVVTKSDASQFKGEWAGSTQELTEREQRVLHLESQVRALRQRLVVVGRSDIAFLPVEEPTTPPDTFAELLEWLEADLSPRHTYWGHCPASQLGSKPRVVNLGPQFLGGSPGHASVRRRQGCRQFPR